MEAMQRVMAGRTTLMIAHRLSTLEICDARLMIEHGRLVEATGNVHTNVPQPTASRASGRR
jgi:ATP-binding cassette, subfamily B, bacterial